MGKGKQVGGRTEKQVRRARRQYKRRERHTAHERFPLDGWSGFDASPEPPDEAAMNADRCPLGPRCVGCGATEHLGVNTTAVSKNSGYTYACATVCQDCDGRSFLHMLTSEQLAEAATAHASHS